MGPHSTKPIRELTKGELGDLLADKNVVLGGHALDHLSDQQRESFEEKELTEPLTKETPRKIYLQENGRYCVYYRKKRGYRKIIISIEETKIVVVSYMDPPKLPRVDI